jgi:outer membrane biogenesis lipoprotein LolB
MRLMMATALLLAGCVTGWSNKNYVKAGATEQQHERDLAECKVTATGSQAGNSIGSAIIAEQTLKNCMESKGWTVER